MDTAVRDALQPILSTVMELAIVLVLGYASVLGQKLLATLQKAKQKYNIDVSEADRQRLQDIAKDAIYYAEEWAAGQRKKGEAVSSGQKYAIAKAFAKLFAPGRDTTLGHLIQSQLGSIKGLGASKDVGE